MSFLSRYKAGEYEQVWREIWPKYWKEVEQEPFYSDALAVAREMMSRVRENLQILIPRLETIGYEVGYGWTLDAEYERVEEQPPPFSPPLPDIQERLEKLKANGRVVPLALQAWYEMVGSVNLVGKPPASWKPYIASRSPDDVCILDPLEIEPLDDGNIHHCIRTGRLDLAPDEFFKYFYGGGGPYFIQLDSHLYTDAFIEGGWLRSINVVDYLRLAFSWGGFPGLGRLPKRPDKDIAYLTKDLLPF